MSGVHRAELADDPASRAKLLRVQPQRDASAAEEKRPHVAEMAPPARQASSSASAAPPASSLGSTAAVSPEPSSQTMPESVEVPIADEKEAEASASASASASAGEEVHADMAETARPKLRSAKELLGIGPKPFTWERFWDETANVSNAANLIAFLLFMLGLGLELNDSTRGTVSKYVLAAGLFGFAGSITNWLAVKMLFDKVPGLYGSGVIPARFEAIRLAMKNMIMAVFFNEEYMEMYMRERLQGTLKTMDLKGKVKEAMADPRLDELIVKNLEGTAKQPGGAIIVPVAAMLGGYHKLVPLIKPLLGAFATEMVGQVQQGTILQENVDVRKIRDQVEAYMDEAMQSIDAELLKAVMSAVIRDELGMLVVWGFIFGAILGVISTAVGY